MSRKKPFMQQPDLFSCLADAWPAQEPNAATVDSEPNRKNRAVESPVLSPQGPAREGAQDHPLPYVFYVPPDCR